MTAVIEFATAIVLGGVVGVVTDAIVGQLDGAWVQATAGTFLIVGGGLVATAISSLPWLFFIPAIAPTIFMMSSFTAMPNYRGVLKSVVTELAAPLVGFLF